MIAKKLSFAPAPRLRWPASVKAGAARLAGAAMLRFHALAATQDWLPEDFGNRGAVDETDPAALWTEWNRQFRRWLRYAPEEVRAWKWGGAMLVVFILALGALIHGAF